MIGLSVSMCVLDIAKGRMKLEGVEKIIGSTSANSPRDWNSIVATYRDSLWRDKNLDCGGIFYKLLGDGKIEQPRLQGRAPLLVGHDGNPTFWVDNESQIQYRPSQRYQELED